jgi:hypothetical protein
MHGLVPFNVATRGGPLLELAVVQARIPDGLKPTDDEPYEEAATAALTEVLTMVVNDIKSRNYRVVLRHVLPLIPELLGTDVTHRRTEAGKALKRGAPHPPKAGSVRTYYEGHALDQLAEDLHRVEAAHQAAAVSRS